MPSLSPLRRRPGRRRQSQPGRPQSGAAEGLPAHRRAQDRHHLSPAGHVAQPVRARGARRRAAGPSPAGPLPRQPGPAGNREAGQRPGGVVDRRVGDPGPPGAAGGQGRGHLARAVLGRGCGAGRPRRRIAAARRGAHRSHRARHRDAAAGRVAGDRQAPQRPRVGGLARRRDRPGVSRCRPAPVVVLARARHAGDPRYLVPSAARGARARHHHPAPGIGQRAAVAALRVAARDRPRRRRPQPAPGRTPRSGWRRPSSCGG